LLVLNRSFTRPVIFRLPSASSAPLSPVRSQPSSVKASRGQLGLLVVAQHQAGAFIWISPVGRVEAALHAVVGQAHGAGRCLPGSVAWLTPQFSVMP
jgi:hypothetical protein